MKTARTYWVLGVGLLGVLAASPVRADDGAWTKLGLSKSFGEHRVSGEATYRWESDTYFGQRVLARLGYDYFFVPHVFAVGGGFARRSNLIASGSRPDTRLYQQISAVQDWWGIEASQRFRLEEMFYDEGTAEIRARYQLSVRFNLIEFWTIAPVIADEIFFNMVDSNPSRRGLEQNRAFVGIEGRMFERLLSWRIGYMNIARTNPDPLAGEMGHLVYLRIGLDF